jgi:hypothetical protein
MNVSSIGVTGQLGPNHVNSITTMGQLWKTLGDLRTADPSKFSSFATNAASELQAAASNQPAGKTQDFLKALGNILQKAASDPNAPLQFGAHTGTYIPRLHPVAEGFIRSLNLQAQAALAGSQG